MNFSLCPYKNAFGELNTGIHSYRILDIAILDVLVVVVLVWFPAKFFDLDFYTSLIAAFLVGIIVHRLFCVKTTVDKYIFGDD